MFALGIRYLNGFVAASEPDDRERAEWPPHPGRVFMALVAAHFHGDAPSSERRALEWLESLGAPTVHAGAAMQREPVTHYVPVNDEPGDAEKPPTAALQSAPQLARGRQPRSFAHAWLENDVAYLAWSEATPDSDVLAGMRSLCERVTRIGHSMSLVAMWVADANEVGDPAWVPDDASAEIRLRVAERGTLEDLERRFNREAVEDYGTLRVVAEDDSDPKAQKLARKELKARFRGEPPPRLRPELSHYQGYARYAPRRPESRAAGTLFSPHLLVFTLERKEGPYVELDLACTLAVSQRWREALLSQSNDLPDGVRELASGHDRAGKPLARPHLAFLPLAFVGHPHADGHLLGMALALPRDLAPEERKQLLRLFGRVKELRLGRLGVWGVRRDVSDSPPRTLRSDTWTAADQGATHWSTVTPIAFDRHPKAAGRAEYQRETAAMVAAACASVGLPRPSQVVVTAVSAHLGVPPAHAFPRLQRKDGSERRHAHAILVFDGSVRGPVVLGAGRYRGYGFCRPIRDTGVA